MVLGLSAADSALRGMHAPPAGRLRSEKERNFAFFFLVQQLRELGYSLQSLGADGGCPGLLS